MNVSELYCFETDREEDWYSVGLVHGLKIADEEPNSQWISMNDSLPCDHKESFFILKSMLYIFENSLHS